MKTDINQPVNLLEAKKCLSCEKELQKKFTLTCSKVCSRSLKKKFNILQGNIECKIKCKNCNEDFFKIFRKIKSEFCSKNCSSKYFQNQPEFKIKRAILNEKRKKFYEFTCPKCLEKFKSNQNNRIFCSVSCSSSFYSKPGIERTDEIKQKIKAGINAFKNKPEYNKLRQVRSDNMKGLKNSWHKVNTDRIPAIRKKQSESLKAKISSGEFTPCINNTWTSWQAKIIIGKTIKKFRSSWEACVWYCNQHWIYERVIVKYKNNNNNIRRTIVDFNFENTLYEIKPKARQIIEKNKIQAVKKFAEDNGYNFILIDEDNIMEYVIPDLFEGENKEQFDKLIKGIR